MTRYLFVSESPVVVQTPTLPDLTARLAPGAAFTVWSAYSGGTSYSADLQNAAGTAVLSPVAQVTDSMGQLPAFRGPDGVVLVWIDFGTGLRVPILSPEAFLAGGGGTVTWPIPGTPTTFPPSAHTHPAAEVSDATLIGRTVMTAPDQQTARSAIGAGTGNGTSNLTLGTTATTAAAGNHTHAASAISFTPPAGWGSTNVQAAIQESITFGGSGGTAAAAFYDWTYSSGAYPALPATAPAGVKKVFAFGPVQPTGLPSWAGLAAGKIPFLYEYLAVA